MGPTRSRYARAVATVISAALVAIGCATAGPNNAASAPDPASLDSAASRSAAMSVLAETLDEDLEIVNGFPELLGFDPPESPPRVLAMAETADDPGVAGSVASTDLDPDLDPATEVESATAADAESTTATAEPEPLPTPPPAAPGNQPLYDNPSDLLIAASGRPFDAAAPTTTGTTRGVTADVIHVGGIVSATLAGQPFRGDACIGAEARYLQANTHRELTRRIVLDACVDDAAQADLSAGLARSLVDDGVFAVAPVASPAFLADAELNESHTPYFGDGALPGYCGRATPFGFGTTGARRCPVLDARGYAVLSHPVLSALNAAAGADGLPSDIMVLAEDGPEGAATLAALELEADLSSLPMPIAGPALPDVGEGAPATWGPLVVAVLDADPDMVIIDGDVTAGLPVALRRRGYEGEIVLVGSVDPLDVADDDQRSELAPLTVVTPGFDLANRATPGWRAMIGAAAAVGVDEDEIGLDFVSGYLSADLLVQALDATLEPLTAERLTQTMNDGWWYPGIVGLACGSWWPASHYVPVPCVSVARVDPFSPQLIPVVDLVEVTPQIRFDLG